MAPYAGTTKPSFSNGGSRFTIFLENGDSQQLQLIFSPIDWSVNNPMSPCTVTMCRLQQVRVTPSTPNSCAMPHASAAHLAHQFRVCSEHYITCSMRYMRKQVGLPRPVQPTSTDYMACSYSSYHHIHLLL